MVRFPLPPAAPAVAVVGAVVALVVCDEIAPPPAAPAPAEERKSLAFWRGLAELLALLPLL